MKLIAFNRITLFNDSVVIDYMSSLMKIITLAWCFFSFSNFIKLS
jgi:hypothetical protein